jgi:hypothetical protein
LGALPSQESLVTGAGFEHTHTAGRPLPRRPRNPTNCQHAKHLAVLPEAAYLDRLPAPEGPWGKCRPLAVPASRLHALRGPQPISPGPAGASPASMARTAGLTLTHRGSAAGNRPLRLPLAYPALSREPGKQRAPRRTPFIRLISLSAVGREHRFKSGNRNHHDLLFRAAA